MSMRHREETRHRFPHRREVRFQVEQLAEALRQKEPDVLFACLLGSTQDGVVTAYGDVDLAVYLRPEKKSDWPTISRAIATAEGAVGNAVEVDLEVLNRAEPIFRHRALQGKILFVRPEAEDAFVEFYTRTCREHEDYSWRLARWKRYRAEVA